MRTNLKTWRESEIIMSLGAERELAAECIKAISLLKDAELKRATKAMTVVLEQAEKNIRIFRKELDRRDAVSDPGPKNLARAFKV